MPPYHFPTKEERKDLIQKMKRLGDESPAAGALYQAYAKAIEELEESMSALYVPEKDGLPPALKKEDAQKLQELIIGAAEAGEAFLSGAEAKQDPAVGLPDAVTKLQDLLSRDFKALAEYDPKTPKSLPELQADSRGLTIDLRNRKLGTVGNLSNSRQFMTVVDALGHKRSGVFTKAVKVKVKSRFQKALEDAKAFCDEAGKAELDKLLPGFRNKMIDDMRTKPFGGYFSYRDTDETIIGTMSKMMHLWSLPEEARQMGGFVEAPLTYDAVRMLFMQAGADPDAVPAEAMQQLINGLDGLQSPGPF